MLPKITKRDGPEIISGHLSQVTGVGGLLHIGGGHHHCSRAFENKPSSLIRALAPFGRIHIKGLIQSVLIVLTLFSCVVVAANKNTLVSVNKLCASASFSFETDSIDPVVQYHTIVDMIANRDERPTLKIYGNGRVQVHHPDYKKNAGDYEMQLSQQELISLLETFANDDLMDFDSAKIKQHKKTIDNALKKQGKLYYISDSVTTQIDINLKSYKSAKTNIHQNNFKKRIRLKDIDHDVKRYKTIGEIQKAGNSIDKLRSLLTRDELKRK